MDVDAPCQGVPADSEAPESYSVLDDLRENHEQETQDPLRDSVGTPENHEQVESTHEQSSEQEEPILRRSSRHREPPRMLTYPEFGNPLVTIVKSLFQGLSTAIVESLPDLTNPMRVQPVSMQRDLHIFRGGGCNQGLQGTA